LEIAVKAKMLTFMLPTAKRLVVFHLSRQLFISATIHCELKPKQPKIFVDAGVSFFFKGNFVINAAQKLAKDF